MEEMILARRRMMMINSFGKPNTFIGGIGVQVNTPAMLAYILSPDLTALDIKNFKINGLNISCYIEKRYSMRVDTFNPVSTGNTGNWYISFGNTRTLTYFVDLDGKVSNITDQNFLFQQNCNFIFLPKVSICVGTQVFRGANGQNIYLNGNYTKFGSSVVGVADGYFNQFVANPNNVYVNIFTATNNAGSPDADIQAYLATQVGANIHYVESGEIPAIIQSKIDSIVN